MVGYDGRWGFIDRTGKIVIAPDYETVIRGGRNNIGSDEDDGESFREGLAMVTTKYKSGFIDKSGNVVIPLQFSYTYPFTEGLAAAAISNEPGSLWGFIDTSGKWAIAPQFDSVGPFSNNLAAVQRGQECFYINKAGDSVLHAAPSSPNNNCMDVSAKFAEGLASFKSGKFYGFLDSSGKIVIKPQFEATYSFSEGIAAVKKKGKWIYIDKTGKTVIDPVGFMPSGSFHRGLAFVRTDDMRYGYIDRSGNFVWKPTLLYANTR